MTDLFAALGLAIVIEGLLYAGFPEQMKQMLARVSLAPASTIRVVALTSAGLGLILLWLVRS